MVHNVYIMYTCIVKQILSYLVSGYNASSKREALYKLLSIDAVLNKKEQIEFSDVHTKARCVRH